MIPPEQDVDWYCLRCGYNLRGLPGDPVTCPECGTANRRLARFRIQQQMGHWKPCFRVHDAADRPVLDVEQATLRLTREFTLWAPNGREELRVRQRFWPRNPVYSLFRSGTLVASVSTRFFETTKQAFCVNVSDRTQERLDGDRTLNACTIRRDSIVVATARIRRFSFSLRSTWDIDIALGEDVPLLIAVLLVTYVAKT